MELNISTGNLELSQEGELHEFYRTYYNSKNRFFNSKYIEWLTLGNPFGPTEIIKIDLNGHIIASMLLVPIELKKSDSILKGYYITDVLTHPKHRDKNLFVKMIRYLVDKCKSQGRFIIGHPNNIAIPGWKRTKMTFQPPLKGGVIIPSISKMLKLKKITVDDSTQLALHKKDLNNLASEHTHVNCTFDFISWRYLNHPTNKYIVRLYFISDRLIGITVETGTRKFLKKVVHVAFKDGFEDLIAGISLIPKFYFMPQALLDICKGKIKYYKVNKEIIFFYTNYDDKVNVNPVIITLAASDV